MNYLSFTIFMQKELQAKKRCRTQVKFDEEWIWNKHGRYYSLFITKENYKEETKVEEGLLFQRVMPENDTDMNAPEYRQISQNKLLELSKDQILKWIYKGMIRTTLG